VLKMSDIGIHTNRVKKLNTSTSPLWGGGQSGGRLADIIRPSTSVDPTPSCSVEVSVEVVLLAEFVREGDAG